MPDGRLYHEQREALRPFLDVPMVHDLGSGDLSLAKDLVRLGAHKVVAIDKVQSRRASTAKVVPITCYFENYPGPVDTAFVSWPHNSYDFGLMSILRRARIVAYLGKNTDGTSCGTPQMWNHLVPREVLAHVPAKHNTLIVYGPELQARQYLPEEYAGLFQDSMFGYEQLEAIAATLPMVGE